MMRFRWLFLSLIMTVSISVNGQYTKEFKRIFFDADYLYETEFYEEAFNRYKNLLTLDPGNSNILFLCGACCLNIPGNEALAITYLKEAAEGISMSYKEHSHKESGAPVLTYYMLGRAYHLNNEFEKAVENYDYYMAIGTNQDPLQLDYAALQIEACERAGEVVRGRPSFKFQSVLDHFDDELPSCSHPVISGDGNILIFLVDYPSDKKVMMTTRSGDLWSRPRVINSEFGMVGETYPVSLSYDGSELYLVHQYYSHSDIFLSRFESGRWSEAEALGHNINGRTSENHASISRDGKTLYFTSDVRGGSGSFDIFVSRLDEKGEWGPPTNLGPVINTPFEEHTPFISSNDSILFFSSQGHASIGGIDVFYADLNLDGTWSEPVNLGYPVNTTGEDLFFNPGWNELDGYYAVRREDDPTSNTLNMVIELEPEEELVSEVEEPDSIDTGQPDSKVVEALEIATITEAIEPEETDEIEEVLNRNAIRETPEKERAEPPAIIPSELQSIIPFDYNEFELNLAATLEVERIAELLDANPETRVALTGHADARGREEYNMLLSLQRADQIAQYLEMRGVNKERISIEGKGEGSPVARNSYPDGDDAPLGRYINRQVLVRITGQIQILANLPGPYVPSGLKHVQGVDDNQDTDPYWFTVQVSASYRQLNRAQFNDFGDIKEYICTDGYYRYTSGAFRTFQDARDHLKKAHRMGYEDAFIQTQEWYERATK
ncbi:MAG: OmpA family protein [Bacteroidota bacterium]